MRLRDIISTIAIVSNGGSTDSEGITLENSLNEAQFNTSALYGH